MKKMAAKGGWGQLCALKRNGHIAVTGGVANPGFPGTGHQPRSLGQRPIVFAEN